MITSLPQTPERVIERHFEHRGFGPEFEMELGWIRSHLPCNTGRIIEVGCGIGALFEMLGVERVIGVDHAARGLNRTAERFPNVPLVCAAAEHLPLVNGSACALVAQHVIEHINDYREACREWFRILKPGGVLIVLTPNATFSDPRVFEDETHVHLFDADDVCHTVTSAGFRVLDVRTLGLPAFRNYQHIAGGWRWRRWVTQWATPLSSVPGMRWRGQTLCCAAVRPSHP